MRSTLCTTRASRTSITVKFFRCDLSYITEAVTFIPLYRYHASVYARVPFAFRELSRLLID